MGIFYAGEVMGMTVCDEEEDFVEGVVFLAKVSCKSKDKLQIYN